MTKILPHGFYGLEAGYLAAVVTSLEMHSQPSSRTGTVTPECALQAWKTPDPREYQRLFRQIGADWLWFSRLVMNEQELTNIIHNAKVEIFRVSSETGMGLLELDFRRDGECELAFFGLSHELQGQGVGRWLMNRAIEIAWSKPIKRFWVHTCSMDHPNALEFYRRSGFEPYQRQIEIAPDPRLTGVLPVTAAPHIPLIRD